MGLLIFIVLVYAGAVTTQLTWRPFAVLAVMAVLATGWATSVRIDNYAHLGQDASHLREPLIFAGNAAIQYGLYLLFYLAGFGVGKVWRSRQPKDK